MATYVVTLYALRRFAALGLAALMSSPAIALEEGQVRDEFGNGQFMVFLREDRADSEDASREPPARSTRSAENERDIYGWHRPSVRALVHRLEATYAVKAVSMTSWAIPSFTAFLPASTERALQADDSVEEIVPVIPRAVFDAWTNQTVGVEMIPWGKIAVGTNDATTTGNPVYMIDGGAEAHTELNLTFAPVNNPSGAAVFPKHATHVAGVLGAANNNYLVRGVNPGAPVINVNRGSTPAEINAAIDWVLADTEQNGIFAVANLSTSGPDFVDNAATRHANYIRRASNRVLFVESAGNVRVNACSWAYSRTHPRDGILVVGGTDENDWEALGYDNTANLGVYEAGTNLGFCIDVWAPSQRIMSTWIGGGMAEMSGTSVAAPYISALAARYGGSSTTPVEREQWIRGKTVYLGNDSLGAPINFASYTQPLASGVHPRAFPVGATADATAPGTNVSFLSNALYLDGNVWSAGHAAPAWVEFDLGSTKTVSSVRLSPEMYPPGLINVQVAVGNTPNPGGPVTAVNVNVDTLEPISIYLGNQTARYLRMTVLSSPSWVAFREIEIYGN